MRMPTLISSAEEWPQYFVLCDYGPKLGRAWSELDPAKGNRDTVLSWLTRGEFTNPTAVMEVNLPAGTCRDVTAEFMAEVDKRVAA
jgi:hypothetical protein